MATFLLLPPRDRVARTLQSLLGVPLTGAAPAAADAVAAAIEEAVGVVLVFADDLPAAPMNLHAALAEQYGFDGHDRLLDCRAGELPLRAAA